MNRDNAEVVISLYEAGYLSSDLFADTVQTNPGKYLLRAIQTDRLDLAREFIETVSTDDLNKVRLDGPGVYLEFMVDEGAYGGYYRERRQVGIQENFNALELAIDQGNIGLVELLLARGADPHCPRRVFFPDR